jgi:hypothetical protein
MTAVMSPLIKCFAGIYEVFRDRDQVSTRKITAAKWQLAADSTKPCQMAF